MKNSAKKQKMPAGAGDEIHPQLTTKSVRSLMREQSIKPPSRVWNKIEAALDEQDLKKKAKKIINDKKEALKKKKSRYLEFAAAVTVIASLIKIIK